MVTLRGLFANDGEEIAAVIARHYLDARDAGRDEADAEELTAAARLFFVRAGERADRSGAPAMAAEAFSRAARLGADHEAAELYEAAARAAHDAGDYKGALRHAEAARSGFAGVRDERGAARAEVLKARALRRLGRHSEARAGLTGALTVLLADPDRDSVEALVSLAGVELFDGHLLEGERVAAEALVLAQALGVDDGLLAECFNSKGLAAGLASRMVEAVVSLETAARLAEAAGNFQRLAVAQLNLADVLSRSDPRRAAEAARAAIAHAERTGNHDFLAVGAVNLAVALIELGAWDEAAAICRSVIAETDHEVLHVITGWLSGLRGEPGAVRAEKELITEMHTSEGHQDQAMLGLLDACEALSTGETRVALSHALGVLGHHEALGIGAETQRLAWPLGVRAARELGNAGSIEALCAILDTHPAGHLPPSLRTGRSVLRALIAAEAAPGAESVAELEGAIESLRSLGNPYELAHSLIDYAGVLLGSASDSPPASQGPGGPARPEPGEAEARARAALAEARQIADRLSCPPLRARADETEAVRAGQTG